MSVVFVYGVRYCKVVGELVGVVIIIVYLSVFCFCNVVMIWVIDEVFWLMVIYI